MATAKRERQRRNRILHESAAVVEAIRGDLVPLTERSIRRDGTMALRLISPGWGSSGHYSANVLEQAAHDRVFPAGTHMYIDHPTLSERSERPERSLRDLAAVLETDGIWQAQHPDGPGIYAQARVFAPYRELLAEMAEHIGVSIRASAEVSRGEAEGRRGPIVERIVEAPSVDFVTRAGRGGQVLAILESAHVTEAMADDVRSWLRDALRDRFGEGEDRWVWVRDYDADTGVVIFDLEGDNVDDPGTYQVAYTLTDDQVELADDEPTKVRVSTTYEPVTEARNVAEWFQSRIHLHFTTLADDMFGEGRLTKEERITLSSGIGAALDAFAALVDERAPQLLTRDLWDEPRPAEAPITESEEDEEMPLNEADMKAVGDLIAEALKPITDTLSTLAEARPAGEGEGEETVEEAAETVELREQLLRRDAADHVRENEKVAKLPAAARKRIVEAVSVQATLGEDGKLDTDALDEATATAIKAEVDYLAEATGSPVRGAGGDEPGGLTESQVDTAELVECFVRLGMTESGAKVAAEGRA